MRLRGAILSLCALCGLSLTAGGDAQEGMSESAERVVSTGGRRIVERFDFEERSFNLGPVPRYWFRAIHLPGERERPGFPNWNESGFDDEHAQEGELSVKLPTRGGSASLRLASGVIGVIPGSIYELRVWVRTEGLTRAKAQMTARYLDEAGEPTVGIEVSTRALRTGGSWTEASLDLPEAPLEAAWIQIDLELLQPAQLRSDLSPEAAARQDIDGAAWFDDVRVMQRPRLRASTGSPINVVVAPARPELVFQLQDLTGETLRAELTVTDDSGAVRAREIRVSTSSREITSGGGMIIRS